MSTDKTTRKPVKLTIPAWEHLGKIIHILKKHGEPGASGTRIVSELILSIPLPSFVQDRRMVVQVDYCPTCETLVPYHNGKCQTCETPLLHLTAMPAEAYSQLMSLARVGSLSRKGE